MMQIKDIVAAAKKEVDANYDYFQTQLEELKKSHFEKFALLHQCRVISFYDIEDDAVEAGMKRFGEGRFSIQQVVDNQVIDLGFQSNVLF